MVDGRLPKQDLEAQTALLERPREGCLRRYTISSAELGLCEIEARRAGGSESD